MSFSDKFFLYSSVQIILLLNFNLKCNAINSGTDITTTTTISTPYASYFTNLFTLPVPSGLLPYGSTALIYCQYNISSPDVGWNKTINGTFVSMDLNVDPRYSVLFYADENSVLTSLLKIEYLTTDDYATYSFNSFVSGIILSSSIYLF